MQPRAPVVSPDALRARHGDARALAQDLIDARRDTLHTFAAFEAALPALRVPQTDELNPPLWELGHIGWFQTYWLARFSQRSRGWRADPDAPRTAPTPPHADALYDSSRVAHADRWSLPLPDAHTTRRALERQLNATLDLLATPTDPRDADLYFFRLALLHEDMHHEASLYMAQALGIALDDARWHARVLPTPGRILHLPATRRVLGANPDAGFAFDNECGQLPVQVEAVDIDSQVVRWHEYLPFVESGGYSQAQWWSAQGWQWRQSPASGLSDAGAPRYLHREGSAWWHTQYGHWQRLDLRAPACHLSFFEAQAWCRWAGRQLPTEAQWEWASVSHAENFRWGDVWEWTASSFAPFAGFSEHPYREYSAPWFDGRPVLRGASFMTQARMRHPGYRNFFLPGRNDISAGFRSCQPAAT